MTTPEPTPAPKFDPQMIRIAIASGVCDDHLESLIESMRMRQRSLDLAKIALLGPGTKFYISARVRPQALAGARVEFTGMDGDKINGILLDKRGNTHKWNAGSKITLFPSHVGEII